MTTRSAPLKDGERVSRLPGHALVNIELALGVWAIGVSFTKAALPLDGPIVPWLAAIALQLLLSAAQANIRAFGLSVSGWPFLVLVGIDVLINSAGLLISYIAGVDALTAAGLYAARALTTGAGVWQCAAALAVGALIAVAPEAMVRAGLGRSP